ncbi:MAG: DMT family transporter [Thermodesulfobacteriota bacterium]
MSWLFLALVAALGQSAGDVLSKRLSREVSDLANVWIRFLYAAPFCLAALLAVEWPSLDRVFWLALAAALPLEITAWLLYLRAIRLSPLGLTIPFLGLTPVFLLVVPRLILGEEVSAQGAAGVLAVATGIYVLNLGQARTGLLEPIRAIGREPGSRLMVLVAVLFSLTATLGKLLIQHSSPLFVAGFYAPVVALALAPWAASRPQVRQEACRWPGLGLAIGITVAVMAVAHFAAVSRAPVAYMIGVKRVSLLLSTLWGWLFFREPQAASRLLGAAVIVAGVFLIAAG